VPGDVLVGHPQPQHRFAALGVVGRPGLSRKSFLLLQKLAPEITKITENCGKTISR
jgi:hypothetical protein